MAEITNFEWLDSTLDANIVKVEVSIDGGNTFGLLWQKASAEIELVLNGRENLYVNVPYNQTITSIDIPWEFIEIDNDGNETVVDSGTEIVSVNYDWQTIYEKDDGELDASSDKITISLDYNGKTYTEIIWVEITLEEVPAFSFQLSDNTITYDMYSGSLYDTTLKYIANKEVTEVMDYSGSNILELKLNTSTNSIIASPGMNFTELDDFNVGDILEYELIAWSNNSENEYVLYYIEIIDSNEEEYENPDPEECEYEIRLDSEFNPLVSGSGTWETTVSYSVWNNTTDEEYDYVTETIEGEGNKGDLVYYTLIYSDDTTGILEYVLEGTVQ